MTPEAAVNFMESMMNIYVQPELRRREVEGAPLSEALWAAQIVFQEGSGPPVVRLNSQVRLLARTDDSDDWVDYADLRRHGKTRVREGTLFPEETGMRHVTMYQVGDDEQSTILRSHECNAGDPACAGITMTFGAGARCSRERSSYRQTPQSVLCFQTQCRA